MRKTILFILFIISITICNAQKDYKFTSKSKSAVKAFEKAAGAYDFKKYADVVFFLTEALKADDNFIEAHMMAGDVYSDMKDYQNSVIHYRRAIEIDPAFFPQNFFNLAKAEMRIEKYEDAKAHLEKFLTVTKITPPMKLKSEKLLAICVFAAEQVKHPVPFNPINLGDSINSTADEYLPMLTADQQTLIFTRRKPKPVQRQGMGPNNLEEDFFVSAKNGLDWQFALPLGPPINTPLNEGGQCISPDGKSIYYTGCDRAEGLGSCDIYFSKKTGNSWSVPVNLGGRVNSKSWDTQPTISFDGKTLFFTSNRASGIGGSDIWKSVKGPDGSWGTATNLGSTINTTGNENSPFIHTDDQTLYFSSDGHPGMGDMDLFYSKIDSSGAFGKPVNLGYPINTSGEEFSLFVSTDGTTGYFSSDRLQGKGALDLFSFEMDPSIRPNVVSYVIGKVIDGSSKSPLDSQIEIVDNETGQTIVNTKSDRINGEFLVCLPSGRDYGLNVSKAGYLFYSDHFSCKKSSDIKNAYSINIEMKKAIPGEKVVLKNIFFETSSFELKSESYPEIGKLVAFLNSNPKIKIEVSGHTDNVGDDKSNQILSEKRAKAVYDYLIKSSGTAGKVTFKGYGETKPIGDNNTEDGKAINRRTEFSILSN